MASLRIVELEDGRYGLQKRDIFVWDYCDKTAFTLWRGEQIYQYCIFENLEEAEIVLNAACEYLRDRKKTTPKIIRVVKQVKV